MTAFDLPIAATCPRRSCNSETPPRALPSHDIQLSYDLLKHSRNMIFSETGIHP